MVFLIKIDDARPTPSKQLLPSYLEQIGNCLETPGRLFFGKTYELVENTAQHPSLVEKPFAATRQQAWLKIVAIAALPLSIISVLAGYGMKKLSHCVSPQLGEKYALRCNVLSWMRSYESPVRDNSFQISEISDPGQITERTSSSGSELSQILASEAPELPRILASEDPVSLEERVRRHMIPKLHAIFEAPATFAASLGMRDNPFVIPAGASPEQIFEILIDYQIRKELDRGYPYITLAHIQSISSSLRDLSWKQAAARFLNQRVEKIRPEDFTAAIRPLFAQIFLKDYLETALRYRIAFDGDQISFFNPTSELRETLKELGISFTERAYALQCSVFTKTIEEPSTDGSGPIQRKVQGCYEPLLALRQQELLIQRVFDETYYHLDHLGNKILWGFKLQPASLGNYKIAVKPETDIFPIAFYSLFTALRVAEGPLSSKTWSNLVFDSWYFDVSGTKKIGPIKLNLFQNLYQILKKSRDCKEYLSQSLEEVFGDGLVQVTEGRKTIEDLFQNSGLQDAAFEKEFGISRVFAEQILQSPDYTAEAVLLNALQVKTHSTPAMLLMETFFKELQMTAFNGGAKTFIAAQGAREPGRLHIANLAIEPVDQTIFLSDCLGAFSFIRDAVHPHGKDAPPEPLQNIFPEPAPGSSLAKFESLFQAQYRAFLARYRDWVKRDLEAIFQPHSISILSSEWRSLDLAETRQEIEKARSGILRSVLNRSMILGPSVWKCERTDIEAPIARQALYPGSSQIPPSFTAQFNRSYQAFESSSFYKERLRDNPGFIKGYQELKLQIASNISDGSSDSFSLNQAVVRWEKFLYLLLHHELGRSSDAQQAVIDFFVGKSIRTPRGANGALVNEWSGCPGGLAARMQELVLLIEKNNGEDPLLRNKLQLKDTYWGFVRNTLYQGEIIQKEVEFEKEISKQIGLYPVASEGDSYRMLYITEAALHSKNLIQAYFSPYDVLVLYYAQLLSAVGELQEDRFKPIDKILSEKFPKLTKSHREVPAVLQYENYVDLMSGNFNHHKLRQEFPKILVDFLLKDQFLRLGVRSMEGQRRQIHQVFDSIEEVIRNSVNRDTNQTAELARARNARGHAIEQLERGFSCDEQRFWPKALNTRDRDIEVWKTLQRLSPWGGFSDVFLSS